VIVVQRVRARWDAASRGSFYANQRRGLPDVFPLPGQAQVGEVVLHDVLLNQANDYAPSIVLLSGMEAVRSAGLWLEVADGSLAVDRLPTWQAFPRLERRRLFTLESGQVARHRANLRGTVTSCCCNPSWYYEQWATHISYGRPWQANMFAVQPLAYDVDDRVHLYGGRARRSSKTTAA
jgi:hypothetical protein